jgi:hypothetical protein
VFDELFTKPLPHHAVANDDDVFHDDLLLSCYLFCHPLVRLSLLTRVFPHAEEARTKQGSGVGG